MSTPVRFVAVRTVGLLLLTVVASLLARLDDGPDANIGLGLLLGAVLLLAAAGWAALDGARAGRCGTRVAPLVLRWVVVALLVAVGGAVWISAGGALAGGGSSVDVLASDLRAVAPFQAVVTGVVAVLALVVARAVGAARR